MRSWLAYSRRLWLVAHSLGSVGGVWWRRGQTFGRAADCLAEHLSRGGGTTPHPGNTFRRSSFLFPPLSGLYCTFTKQTQSQHIFKSAAEYIYNLHARRIYNILHERAIIILSYTHTPARPCLFFSFFFFFLFLFFFYLFFYLFFYIPFLFVCLFAFRRFLFFCFVFLFFSPRIFATVQAAARG